MSSEDEIKTSIRTAMREIIEKELGEPTAGRMTPEEVLRTATTAVAIIEGTIDFVFDETARWARRISGASEIATLSDEQREVLVGLAQRLTNLLRQRSPSTT
jgi:hypothetical protein